MGLGTEGHGGIDMKRLGFAAFFAAGLGIAPVALAQEQSDAAAIRAGKNIAVTSCVACHVVSPGQTVLPVLGTGASFADIANRSDSTPNSLSAAMLSSKAHDPGKTGTLLPMGGISDAERLEVAAYILSLRTVR